MIRSLAVKLTLAFLAVGISGSLLVAAISAQRTRLAFDRFVSQNSDNSVVAVLLLGFYEENEYSWEGIEQWLNEEPSLSFLSRLIVLADSNHKIIYSPEPGQVGREADASDSGGGISVIHDDELVGTAYLSGSAIPGESLPGFSPESFFLYSVNQATVLAAIIAGLLALALGILLSRALTRPLRQLTLATQEMAAGQFGKQVDTPSQDEIGKLATAFNRMSKDLAQASGLRRQMTADIAHDLRTPLTILRGYTEGLRDGSIKGEEELYELLHLEVVHLQHMVEDLRTLSLADAGELTLSCRVIDPKALLERAGLAHVVSARQKNISMEVVAPDTLPSVSVDVERMTQVLDNLVANALRFTTEGEIVLSGTNQDGTVTLHVADSGTGIPPEELDHIFDRFYKVDRSRHRDGQAQSGLGLAIAKAIVEAHDGTISAESTPGEGTRFTIQLPKSPNPQIS